MKSIQYIPLLLAVSLLLCAMPTQAEESIGGEHGIKEQKGYKDECLLLAINCGNNFYTLEQKIDKLQQEISKGTDVYTTDELRKLREDLNSAKKKLEYFKYDGASNLYRFPGE